MHIEFYGLPGSGKSTISKLVSDQLAYQKYLVIQASAETGITLTKYCRIPIKAFRTIIVFFKFPALFFRTMNLVRYNNNRKPADQIKQIVNVAQKLFYYLRKGDNDIVYVWDEGLVQASISLALKGNTNSLDNEKSLLSFCREEKEIVRVYLKQEIPIVMDRLDMRETKHSRIEKISDRNQKYAALVHFKELCDQIESDILIECEDMKPQSIADLVYSVLKNKYSF